MAIGISAPKAMISGEKETEKGIFFLSIKWRKKNGKLVKVYVDTYNFSNLVKLAPHSSGKVPVRLVSCKFL